MKPTILVDMDGVLADFDGWIYERQYLWPSLDPDRSKQTHYFLTDEVSRHDAAVMRQYVNQSRIFRELAPMPGAVLGFRELAEEADVWICTKPLEANGNTRDDKAEWVRNHLGPEFEGRLIITPDKSLVLGAILLDDHPKPKQIEQAVCSPVIYEHGHNVCDYEDHPHFLWEDGIDFLLAYSETVRG